MNSDENHQDMEKGGKLHKSVNAKASLKKLMINVCRLVYGNHAKLVDMNLHQCSLFNIKIIKLST